MKIKGLYNLDENGELRPATDFMAEVKLRRDTYRRERRVLTKVLIGCLLLALVAVIALAMTANAESPPEWPTATPAAQSPATMTAPAPVIGYPAPPPPPGPATPAAYPPPPYPPPGYPAYLPYVGEGSYP